MYISSNNCHYFINIHLSVSLAVMCPQLTQPTNGTITYATDMSPDFDFLTIATYSCNTNFALVEGDSIRQCSGDNTWNGTAPSCEGMFT